MLTMRRRHPMRSLGTLITVLLVAALPLLAAGCIKPNDEQLAQGGTCEQAAFGWLRWNQSADLEQAESALRDMDMDVRRYVGPDGDLWLVFRVREGGANPEFSNFRSVIRVFNLSDSPQGEGGNQSAAQAGAGEGRNTMISFLFDTPDNQRPFEIPIEQQRAQMEQYSQFIETNVANRLNLRTQADTRFYDERAICPTQSADDLDMALTPEGQILG